MALGMDILAYALIAAFFVASVGLWWFQLVLRGVKKLSAGRRYGVYVGVWLAYFILTLILIAQAQQ